MIYQKLVRFFAIMLMIAVLPALSMAANPKNGKSLFLSKCASCHNANMKDKSTGPALGGVDGRWEKAADLRSWIKNSQALIAEGNPYANQIFAEYGTVMPAFPELKDADVDDILEFIKNKAESGCAEPPCKEAATTVATTSGANNEQESDSTLLWVLSVVLVVVVGLLGRYINSLQRIVQGRDGSNLDPEKSFFAVLFNPSVVKILIFLLVLVGGFTTVKNAIGLGRQQDYAPTQPIAFSHELHAGKNGIDCQYCHDGARRSKHSVIPAANTCINCHAAVKKGPNGERDELLKVYIAAGFDPDNGVYIDQNMSEGAKDSVYTSWLEVEMADELIADEEGTKAKIASMLKAAKSKVSHGQPIEWVRIHNLPDHVYFNHAQHVTVGKVKCQTCHGAVEKMEVLKQHSPLSMGWCINCHRQTEVQFRDGLNEGQGKVYAGKNKANPYYTEYKYYEKYHNELKEKQRKGVTVEEIGGLECQKCHY